MDVLIRSEQPGDYGEIDAVLEAAFKQENEAVLVRTLRKTPEFNPNLSLVALAGGELVGHILFYPVEVAGGVTLVLAPMSVKPGMQGKGVGGRLIKAGFEKAVEEGYDSVVLVGYPDYYTRFGFEKASGFGLKLSFEVPDEAFMAIELAEGSLKGKAGLIELPKPYMDCA